MPRVLRILNRLIIGGPAINATYLTKYMTDFDTKLVIGGKDDHEEEATHLTDMLGIEPVYVPHMKRAINPLNDRIAYNEVRDLIRKFKPDIIHTHAAKAGVIGRLAASSCNVPVILHTFHGHVFHSYFSKMQTNSFIMIERYLAKKSSGIIAISESQKKELANVYNICEPEKIEIIPLGLDIDKFIENPEKKRAEFRKKFFIEDDEIAIGIIGRIVPVKNHQLFIAAADKLRKLTNKKLKFLIIGDGDIRAHIQAECIKRHFDYVYYPDEQRSAYIIFTSWQTQIDHVLDGLDIVALTSHNEGTPLSLIEAQAAGKPLVSTNVGGVLDVVNPQLKNFITPPGDEGKFANALLQLVENEHMRKSIGERGREFALSKFSYQRLVKDMNEYYYRLLEESKKRK